MMPRVALRVSSTVALTAVVWLSAGFVRAQSTYGTLLGTVTDPSGGVIPGASITATNTQTGVARSVTTDARGNYELPNLEAGRYAVKVSTSGFADTTRTVELLARETFRVDLKLELAKAGEVIEVKGERPVIETDSDTISHSRSGSEIDVLALNFRATTDPSPLKVAALAPGVQADSLGNISVSGLQPDMTQYSIDGISTQRVRGGDVAVSRYLFPSVESMDEFKVNASGNDAEFQQVGDITVTSKSGSNDFHGAIFGFLQASSLAATGPFISSIPDYKGKTFGATLGGPIVKDKVFFHFTYEGVRLPQPAQISELVPPDAFRNGDFSSLPFQLINPYTGKPYPNNQVPVNPVMAQILNTYFAHQNQATGASLSGPNLIESIANNFTTNGFDGRLDFKLSNSQTIFVRGTYKNLETDGINPSDDYTTYNTTLGTFTTRTEVRNAVASHNWVINPSLVSELRAGFSSTREISTYPLASQGGSIVKGFGLAGLPPTPPLGGAPAFAFTDGLFYGGQTLQDADTPRNILSQTFDVNENLTMIKGRHSFKFGVGYQHVQYQDEVTFFAGEDFGQYAFSSSPGLTHTGFAFADFLLGLPSRTTYAQNGPVVKPYASNWSGYAQDKWEVNPKLTVNIGVRYDILPPYQDANDGLANFDRNFPGGRVIVSDQQGLNLVSPLVRASVPNTPFVLASAVGLPKALRYTDYSDIRPRFGFAYRPKDDEKTVIRGSFGMYTTPLLGGVNYSLAGVVTSYVPTFTNQLLPSGNYAITFPNPFPASLVGAPGSNPDFRRANQFDLQNPKTTQWSLTVEQDLGWQTGVRLSYIGDKAINLIYSPDLNEVQPNTLGYAAVASSKPYGDWNAVLSRDNGPYLRYDGFTADLQKRMSHGLQFEGSYTLAFGKSNNLGAVPLATASVGGFGSDRGVTYLDRFDIGADYGNTPNTRRHRVVLTFLWKIPYEGHGLAKALLGGWDVAGTGLYQSGAWLTPFQSANDPSGTGSTIRGVTGKDRPDLVGPGDGNLSNPTPAMWFTNAPYAVPGNNIGRFGNAPVATLLGPDTKVFSLTLAKNFALSGRTTLRVEAAASNIFNITNYANPPASNMNILSSSFGRITAVQTADQAGPLNVQLAARLSF